MHRSLPLQNIHTSHNFRQPTKKVGFGSHESSQGRFHMCSILGGFSSRRAPGPHRATWRPKPAAYVNPPSHFITKHRQKRPIYIYIYTCMYGVVAVAAIEACMMCVCACEYIHRDTILCAVQYNYNSNEKQNKYKYDANVNHNPHNDVGLISSTMRYHCIFCV